MVEVTATGGAVVKGRALGRWRTTALGLPGMRGSSHPPGSAPSRKQKMEPENGAGVRRLNGERGPRPSVPSHPNGGPRSTPRPLHANPDHAPQAKPLPLVKKQQNRYSISSALTPESNHSPTRTEGWAGRGLLTGTFLGTSVNHALVSSRVAAQHPPAKGAVL